MGWRATAVRMVGKRPARGLVDGAMVGLLLFQMARQFLPSWVHEATGLALAALVVVHVGLHLRWYRGLIRGSWTPWRGITTLVNIALTLVLIAMVASGFGMSGMAVGLGIAGHTMVLRSMHMALVHAGFMLAGLHLGLHGRRWGARLQRSGIAGILLGTTWLGLALYGAYAFVKLNFWGYLTLRTQFAFIDPSQSVVLFVLDHLAIFALCAAAGCGISMAQRPGRGVRLACEARLHE